PHRLCISKARERQRQLDSNQLEDAGKQPFGNRVNLIERGKTHLDVELSKLGLPIRAQILVAKTSSDLKIFIQAGNHAQLFEQLRRLRQCKELSRLHARGNDVISRALGR